jgi:hypothetical protein
MTGTFLHRNPHIGSKIYSSPHLALPSGNADPYPEIIIKIMKKMKPGSDIFEKHPEIIDHMVLVMKSHNQVAMTPHTLEKYNRDSGIAVRDRLYFLFGSNLQDKRSSVIELLDEGQYSYKIFDVAGNGLNIEKPEMVNKEIVTYLNGK